MLDGAKILRETWEVDDVVNSIVPLYDNEDSVCGIEYNDTAYYFLKNLQGDIIAITDSSGEEVARYSYDAWGKATVFDTNGVDITERTTHIANINPFRYRSYYFDLDTKLYYLQSRYYDAQVGRFVNGDEAELIIMANLTNNANLFGYCNNAPTFDSDDVGNLSFTSVKKAISNVVNNIKGFIINLVNYIKKQFKKFLSKVSCHFNKGYLRIPTTPIGFLIDAVITTISGLVKGALLKGGFTLIKLWFKSNRPALKTFIKSTVIPLLKNTDVILNGLIKYIANRFKWKCALTITKAKIETQIFGKYDFYKWISAVSSVGSFIATVLDILDGKWDNYLAI